MRPVNGMKHVLPLSISRRYHASAGVSAAEQRCVGWNNATFGSPLVVVHTQAAAAIVCGSGGASDGGTSVGACGGVCVGLRGHTVWRHVVLHAAAPATALCSEVRQQFQQYVRHSCVTQGLSAPFAFAAATLCDVHLCDEVTTGI